jgi:hypothetical protein
MITNHSPSRAFNSNSDTHYEQIDNSYIVSLLGFIVKQ